MKKFKDPIFRNILLIAVIVILGQASVPTIIPENSLLNQQSNYVMSYFAFKSFQTTSYFQLDFSQCDIAVNDGPLNVTANLGGTPITSSSITANCTNKLCIIKLGTSFATNTNVEVIFGQLRNPKYTANQRINVLIYFGVNSNQTQTVTVSSSVYLPMPVTVNSVTQSDFGVGTQDVTYVFNVSFSYIPKDPEISIEIPTEVGYNNLDTELSFYGTVQNFPPFLTGNIIAFSLTINETLNPKGFMLLTLRGFRNPRFIGTSKSFNISMVQKKIATTNNCVSCRVAFLYANASKLLTVSSTTPGDITMNMFTPSSYMVSDRINLTIGIKIVAPIPDGGKFRILLPSSIVPSMPIFCEAVYGFTVATPSYCIYNETLNAIETVNFSIPYLEQTGDAIIRIGVINPKENRQTQFNFETEDDQKRKIGKNREPFVYSATPKALISTIAKNTTYLESYFTLTSTVTLTQPLDKTTDSILVVLPPSEFYNLTAIQCVSSQVEIPCTKTFQNYTNNLLVKFVPPCSVCNSSSSITFKINNLINPSFINDDMQSLEIQTVTAFGIIETYTGSIGLKEKQLVINQLNWNGGNTVGSDFAFNLNYELPKYIQSYGGYLVINLNENSTYTNVIVSGTSYSYPTALSVKNENNQSLVNTLIFYDTSKIKSIKQIKIKLCTTDSFCGSNLTIFGLRKSFYPLQSAFVSFKATTLNDESISTTVRDISSFMPQAFASSLNVLSTISIANTISNYVFGLTMNKIPFDSGLKIDLSSKHKFQDGSRCFVQTTPSTILGYGIDCQIISNSSSFSLTYTGDITFMTVSSIDYKITVVNVLNPPSLIPFTYKIETSINSYKNGQFSASYSIDKPYTLTLTEPLKSSNTTFGQSSNLSAILSPGYFAFDQMKIYVPKENFKTLTTYNLLALTAGSYKVNENSTFFTIDKIYVLDGFKFTLQVVNALSTAVSGKLTVEMYVQGYLSSKGVFDLPKIQPVYLYATAVSSSRFVGQSTSLTFDVRRVNAFAEQKTLKISFNNTVFITGSSNQLYTTQSSNTQLSSWVQTISTWSSTSKNIVLSALQNMKFVPSPDTITTLPKIVVSTFDSSNAIVSTISIDLVDILPNKVKDGLSYTFTRTQLGSYNTTDIVIDYMGRNTDKAKILKIQLPKYQNKLSDSSSCVIGQSGTTQCQIIQRNQTSLTIQYPANQQKITLKQVLNQFPSDNNLTLSLFTDQRQLIESSTKQILPKIDYDPLEVTCVVNSSQVGANVKLQFNIKSVENMIEFGSKVKFVLPDKIYSKYLGINYQDCDFEAYGNKYTGCQYNNFKDSNGYEWLQQVSLTYFGNYLISNGSIFKVTLYLTNPWSSFAFAQKSISVILSNGMGQQTSKGTIPLPSLYPTLTRFVPVTIQTSQLKQTSRLCTLENTLTLSMTLPTTILNETIVSMTFPKAYFIVNLLQNGLSVSDQDPNNFLVTRKVTTQCTQLFLGYDKLCMRDTYTLSIDVKVKNEKYFKLIDPKPKVTVYLMSSDNNLITKTVEISVDDRIPTDITGLTLQRSTGNLFSAVTSTLKYTLPVGFDLTKSLKVSISPINSSIGFAKSLSSSKIVSIDSNGQLTTSNLENIQTGSTFILTLGSLASPSVTIQLQGMNPSFAPNVQTQKYSIKIYDSTYVYHANNITLSVQNRLKPLTEGLTVVRSVSTVDTLSTYSVTGRLPIGIQNGQLAFNGSWQGIPMNLTSTEFNNIKIGDFMTPSSINWDVYQYITIMNYTHILYSNNRLKATPKLESLTLPSNTIATILYNKVMRINTYESLLVKFSNSLTGVSKVNFKLPPFFRLISQVKVNTQSSISLETVKISSLSSTQSIIEIPLTGLQVQSLEITFQTLEFQKFFLDQSITIETQYPTKSYQQAFSVSIYGSMMTTNIQMSSRKVNEYNSIHLGIKPLDQLNSKLVIYFPTFLNSQLQTLQTSNQLSSSVKLLQNSVQRPYTVNFNSTSNLYYIENSLSQSSLASTFVLSLNSVVNPSTNQPFYFIVEQYQSGSNQVFGHSQLQVRMTVLEQIFVKSSQRNTSKIGANIQVSITIQLPTTLPQGTLQTLTQSQCIIQLPSAQVTRLNQSLCQVFLSDPYGQKKLPCTMHPSLQNAIITSCSSGINSYLIKKGFKNMMYAIIPNVTQKPYVFIGQQYKMAESNVVNTQALSPIITSGSLVLNKLASSSSVRLRKTTLSSNMTLENVDEVDCINFRFQTENYLYRSSDLRCVSNSQPAECWSNEPGSIMVNISSTRAQNLSVQIQGLVNYLRQGSFTIKTLKYLGPAAVSSPQMVSSIVYTSQTDYAKVSEPVSIQSAPQSQFALIDIFYSSLSDVGQSFVSDSYNVRVINPQNYVSEDEKKIQVIFDDEALLPSLLAKDSLSFSITSNIDGCSLLNADYSQSLTMKCKFTQSMTFTLKVKLFHKLYQDIELSSTTSTSFIYPPLQQNCANQMCDKCSTGPSGQEKCFSCRQNNYEYQNGCVADCPSGYTAYQESMSCEQCSSTCSTCYGLYSDNCLKCQNSTLLSDNGLCVEQCKVGYSDKGFCLGDNQCYDTGCRLCSMSGFCYECLPDYSGEPNCQWQQLLPPLFMSFFIIPFAIYAVISCLFYLITKGSIVLSYQVIFSFSLLQFMTWIFIIPALHTKQQAMVLLSMIIFRIIIGIVAYETYYKKQINSHIGLNEEETLLEKEQEKGESQKSDMNEKQLQHFDENWKSRLMRFLAHTNGIDTYEGFKVVFDHRLRIEHNNLYLWISTGNRLLTFAIMFYVLSQSKIGDLLIMPLVTILSGFAVLSLRTVKSKKVQEIWTKLRSK